MVCKGRICLFANSCKWLCKAIRGVYLSIHCAIECSILQRLCKSYAGTFQTLSKNAEKRPVWAAFLILIQHAKRSDSPRFPAGQHPKNGFISPFAGKNSFLKPHVLQNLILRDPSQRWGETGRSFFAKLAVSLSGRRWGRGSLARGDRGPVRRAALPAPFFRSHFPGLPRPRPAAP